MAVLRSWSQLSGSSRFCVHFEKKREEERGKGKEEKEKEKEKRGKRKREREEKEKKKKREKQIEKITKPQKNTGRIVTS